MRSYPPDVTKGAQLYIWRKLVSRASLAELEAALTISYAAIDRPHRKRVTIEAVTAKAEAQLLQKRFGGTIRPLPRDWEAQMFAAGKTKPLRIGKRLVIAGNVQGAAPSRPPRILKRGGLEGAPPWTTQPTSVLVIPAGAAFGTGEHATTAMSLRMLERVSRSLPAGWRMLDAGTGSGILALAGERFGAGKVLAIENDPLALATARENAEVNRSTCVTFKLGDVRRGLRGRFEVITGNLYSELLASVLPRFRRCLAPGGTLILSGVMRQQERELTAALQVNGFGVEEARRRGKWVALRCAA